jgi:hypothetical protein
MFVENCINKMPLETSPSILFIRDQPNVWGGNNMIIILQTDRARSGAQLSRRYISGKLQNTRTMTATTNIVHTHEL